MLAKLQPKHRNTETLSNFHTTPTHYSTDFQSLIGDSMILRQMFYSLQMIILSFLIIISATVALFKATKVGKSPSASNAQLKNVFL